MSCGYLWDFDWSRCAWQTLGVSLPGVCGHETPWCLPGEKLSSGREASSRQAWTCNEVSAITWEGQFWARHDAAVWICPLRDSGLNPQEEGATKKLKELFFAKIFRDTEDSDDLNIPKPRLLPVSPWLEKAAFPRSVETETVLLEDSLVTPSWGSCPARDDNSPGSPPYQASLPLGLCPCWTSVASMGPITKSGSTEEVSHRKELHAFKEYVLEWVLRVLQQAGKEGHKCRLGLGALTQYSWFWLKTSCSVPSWRKLRSQRGIGITQ